LDHILSYVEEINYLTFKDKLEIVSTFHVIHDSSSYNCVSCKHRHTQQVRDERKGCSKPTIQAFSQWRKGEISYKRCPVNYYSGSIANLIDSFRHFERGVLPYQGGLFEQSNKLIEAYSLIESLKLEYQKDQYEAQSKAQSRLGANYGK
jgi:hypothetical protein